VTSLSAYRDARKWTQSDLARALGVSQAYVSQLEAGTRPISRKLAARLARLPDLPPGIVPPGHADLDAADADFAEELTALGYPGFTSRSASIAARDESSQPRDESSQPRNESSRRGGAARETPRTRTRLPRNPAAVIVAILSRRQVAPSVMAAIPWVLVAHADLDASWLVDQTRRRNLQNRLGFLTDLALDIARARAEAAETAETDIVARLDALRADLETSRLANVDTLARVLTSAERQFFEEHRGAAARHWNLLTGLTVAQLPYK